MFPVLFTVGSISVKTLPFFLGLAFFSASFLFWRETRYRGFSEEGVFNLILVVFVFSFIFGRIAGIILNQDFAPNLYKIIFGRVSVLGSLFGAFTSSYLYLRRKNWSFYTIGDIAVIPIIVSQIIGEMGKWLSGGGLRVLVETLLFIVLLVVFIKLKRKKYFTGLYLFLYIFLFSLVRILSAVISGDHRLSVFFTYSLLLLMSMLAFIRRRKMVKFNYLILGVKRIFPMLSKEAIEKAKNILIRKRKKIIQERMNLEKEDPYLAPGRADHNAELADDVQEDIEHESVELQKEALDKSKEQIDKALSKVEEGSYGICGKCGHKIDPARLKAYPEATECLRCVEAKGH